MPKPPKTISSSRHLAVNCLIEVEKEGVLVPDAMSRIAYKMSDEDRNFAYKIIFDTYRNLPGLQKLLNHYCNPSKLPAGIRWILLSSLCQIVFTRAAHHAIANEANKLAMTLGFPGLKRLVNGVLRNVMRTGESVWTQWDARTWILPEWLDRLLSDQFTPETINQWLETWGERGGVSYWSAKDKPIDGDSSGELPHAWRRLLPISPNAMRNHGIYIQNESSQAVAELACRLKPETMLDLCAAPGGKSCYISAFGNVQKLLAIDASAERMGRLHENKTRLGLNFEAQVADARQTELEPEFDLVLADAPCSGIGIIGRRPEIKFLKKEPVSDEVAQLQKDILQEAWRLCKPGGYLLYTVCSLDRNERPAPPEGAILANEMAQELWCEKLPVSYDDQGFFFSPTNIYDGFTGMLLKKSENSLNQSS